MAVSHYKSRQLAVCFMPRHVSEVWKYIVPCGTGLFLNILYMPLHVKEVKQTNCSAGQTIRNLVFIRLHSGENSSSLLIQAGCMEPMAKLILLELCWKYNLLRRMWHSWQISNFVYSFLFPFPAAEHLTARPGRPRPAPAVPLTNGQPWYQHSDPAGSAFSSVQLCHHSGSIH